MRHTRRASCRIPAISVSEERIPMSERIMTTLVIGLLAAGSVLLTNYWIHVPIWVVFVAWASFFAAGGA
jgi:uncharacterized protein (DUF983 family)